MTNKEKNMMKLVSYHLIYIEGGRVPKEKKEKLFVEVYNHFNKRNKKKLTKRSDIVAYMSELKKQRQQRAATALGKVVKRVVSQEGRLLSLAIGAGLMCSLALRERTKKETED